MGLTQRRTARGGPAVRRLAAGLLLSRTGDQLTTIALLWFVLDLTGSGAAVGLVLLCAGLPPVVTGTLLGRMLDRRSPRRVMVADNLLRALLVGAIPALHWLGRLDLPLLYGLSMAAGALIPATDVGVRVVLPRLVDSDQLEHANALLGIGDQVSALVGPACGGLLVGLLGAPPVLLLDAASFLAMAALVWRLPDPPATAVPRPAAGTCGIRAALAEPAVRVVLAVTLVYFLAYGPLEPALPVYSRDALGAGAGGYGLLWSAFGAGALAGLATVPVGRPPAPRARPGRERPRLGDGAPAPAGRHRDRPGDAGPGRRRADLGAVRDPGVVPAPAAGPGPPARPGVRCPPGRLGRGRAAGRRRRRAPPRPRPVHGGDRRVRRHLHVRRRGRPLRPGPPPSPGPGAPGGGPARLTAAAGPDDPGRALVRPAAVSRETSVGRRQRGNPVRIRSCPAAVCGNERRHRGARVSVQH